MTVNLKKTKVLIFNTPGKIDKATFQLGGRLIENVSKYKYLGILFQASGSFAEAKLDLYNKALKALRRIFSSNLPNVSTLLHIFDHTIRPILLYGCEIWGYLNPLSSK
jgi:hypothetical protein